MQIETSLVQRINETHDLARVGVKRTRAQAIAAMNHARECGILLGEYKEKCSHGEFQIAFKTAKGKDMPGHIFEMSYEQGSQYMRIATRYDTEFTEENWNERMRSQRELLYATGEAEIPQGHGEQNLLATQANSFVQFTRHLMAFRVAFEKQKTLHPLNEWTHDVTEQFVDELEPIVEDLNGIYAAAKAHLNAA